MVLSLLYVEQPKTKGRIDSMIEPLERIKESDESDMEKGRVDNSHESKARYEGSTFDQNQRPSGLSDPIERISNLELKEEAPIEPKIPSISRRESSKPTSRNSSKSQEQKSIESAIVRFSLANSRSSSDSLRAMNIEKRIESRYFPFVSEGMNSEMSKFRSFTSLYFNLAWLGRFCTVMFAIAALQLNPGIQVFFILIINTLFFLYFCRAFFKAKVFSGGISTYCLLYQEVIIEIFFVLTVVLYFNDLYGNLSGGAFRTIQICCIVMIYMGILFEIVNVMSEIIILLCDARKKRRQQKEEKKELESKRVATINLDESEQQALEKAKRILDDEDANPIPQNRSKQRTDSDMFL